MTATPRKTIRIADQEWAALKAIAQREGKEVSQVILEALVDKYPEFKPAPRKEGRPPKSGGTNS